MIPPSKRPRRLRSTVALRDLLAETSLSPNDIIAPLFVKQDIAAPIPIRSMPGINQNSLESLSKEVDLLYSSGIRSFMIFGIPSRKDPLGSEGYSPDGITQIAISTLKAQLGPSAVIMADLCLDEFTDHGHCGILGPKGNVENDSTVELYCQMAIEQAKAGVDFVAPSGMMDGQVRAIRTALDGAGYLDVGILAYSAKYASAYYGPFRDAVDVSIADGGDRKTYQQDYRNAREAFAEIELDIAEGADIVMIKPAMSYLDIIARIRDTIKLPLAAYQVSGEFAMIKAADAAGFIDGNAVALEQLYAIKRAGADLIISYFAHDLAELLS